MKNLLLKFLMVTLTAAPTVNSHARDGASIVGSWSDSGVGLTQYENKTTGALKPGRGSSFTYKFSADGTFEYIGYMEVTTYNCTTTLFNHKTGAYTLDGQTVTFHPTKDHWKNANTCAPSGDKSRDKTPVDETATWQVGRDENGRTILVLNTGKGDMKFRRER